MSAPLIWIIFPLVVSVGLWFMQKNTRAVLTIALIVCGLLGLAALLQPIGGILKIGPTSVEIKTTAVIFGRSFILENKDRFFLTFIYFAAVFWFLGSRISAAPDKFIPLSLAIIAMLTSALAVSPFLYSAILIEIAVIVSLPLLLSRGAPIGRGVLRYFIYQSMAMPFILFSGWMLSGSQANPSDTTLLQAAALLLGLGFAFWLAVFPFHVWMPELAEESHAYLSGFLLSVLPPVYLLIALKYVNGLNWLKNAAFLTPTLQTVGIVMVVTAGVWAAVQTNLKRLFGFAVIMQSGIALICISFQSQVGDELFYLSLIPHMLELGVFAYALVVLQRNQIAPYVANLTGLLRKFPLVFLGLLTALFSIIGLPLFAGFSFNIGLLELFTDHISSLVWIWIGFAGLAVAALRLLVSLLKTSGEKWTISETTGDLFFLTIGIFVLVLMGIFPSVFIGGIWKTFSALLALS
jgi:Formate hydrogenlyase subunit 3/Multisubunit Na+/H+ antiporter, MnhD subunit